jgi:hypothetical protein
VATGGITVVVVPFVVSGDDDSVVAGGLAGLAVDQCYLSMSSCIISVCVAVDDVIIIVVDVDGKVIGRSRGSRNEVSR